MKSWNAVIFHCQCCGRVIHQPAGQKAPQCCNKVMSEAAAETIYRNDNPRSADAPVPSDKTNQQNRPAKPR